MSYFKQNVGFTLIELIVVVSLISLLLFIAIPRFQNAVFSDPTQTTSRWIIANVRTLKENAVRNQMRYALNIDLDSNKMWVTNASMSEDELENASQNAFELPDDMSLLEVEYPDDSRIPSGRAGIYFYKKGYSDMAIIHIEDSDSDQLSFRIEPFLPQVKMYQTYVGFEG